MNNSQYNKIMRDYNKKQLINKHNLDLRVQEVYDKIPEIKLIDEEIASNSINYARKLLLESDQSALAKVKDTNLDLSMRKIELLYANGLPKDYLLPSYHCNNCKDTGYNGNEKCHCFKQAIVDLVYAQSNIKDILEFENFNTFSYDYYSDIIDNAYETSPLQNIISVVNYCKDFISNFNKEYANILLYGSPGVGKTFLTNCIAKDLLDSGNTVIYLTSFQLFDILEKYKFGKNDEDDNSEDMFDYILNCDLLIIDDLGTELNNSFISSQLFLCINERHLRKKSTIISTNLSLQDLNDEYSERFFSRISGNYELLHLFGEDIRLQKAFE